MKSLLTIFTLLFTVMFSSTSFAECPDGTWNRNQYSGPGGGMYTGPGGGMYTGPGGGLYTGPGEYCTNRPPITVLKKLGIL